MGKRKQRTRSKLNHAQKHRNEVAMIQQKLDELNRHRAYLINALIAEQDLKKKLDIRLKLLITINKLNQLNKGK
jgi:hypothetical protein